MDELLHHNINQLFISISEGDESAFNTLFRQSVPVLYPFIFRLVKQAAAAEEVIQSSFLRIWLSRDKLAGITHAKAWLYKVVANECYTYLRKEARELQLRSDAWPGEEADNTLAAELSLHETQRLITQAVSKLPPQRRRIFIMSRQQGLSIPEIAENLGLSPNSVKNTLVLALRDIREHLARHGQFIPVLVILFCLNARASHMAMML